MEPVLELSVRAKNLWVLLFKLCIEIKDDLYVTRPGASMCWSSIAPRAETTSSPPGPITLESLDFRLSADLSGKPSHRASCTSQAILLGSFPPGQTAQHSCPPGNLVKYKMYFLLLLEILPRLHSARRLFRFELPMKLNCSPLGSSNQDRIVDFVAFKINSIS